MIHRSKHIADKELDASGLKCPMPVLRTRRSLEDMQPGEILRVTATDETSVHDMPAFCRMAGHELLLASTEEENYIFEIRRGNKIEEDAG